MAFNKVEDPNSDVTKQTTIEENSDGTKKTTTIENKTNNPKWRGENNEPSEWDKRNNAMWDSIREDIAPIPGNDSLAGNYYGDEVALVGDSAIFDQNEFGIDPNFGSNTVTMTHPSGVTVKAYSPEEVAMYEKNGYVAPNATMNNPITDSAAWSPNHGYTTDDIKAGTTNFDDHWNEYEARPDMPYDSFFGRNSDTDAMGNPIQDQSWDGRNINTAADRYANELNNLDGMGPSDDYYEGPIPGNDSLAGNYYGDEVSGNADNSFFDDVEWGGRDATPYTMYHPSGFTRTVAGDEEANLFKKQGYFSTAEEAQDEAAAEEAFNKADASQSAFENQWDAEQNSLNNIPDWLGQSKGPMTDAERDSIFEADNKARIAKAREYAAGLKLPHMIDGRNKLLRPAVAGPREETPEEKANRKYNEWEAKMKAEGQILDSLGSYQPITTDETFFGIPGERNKPMELPNEAPVSNEDSIFDMGTPPSVEPPSSVFDKEPSSKTDSINEDQEEVNKSEVAKEVVTTFQDRINAGADPQAELKRFVDSSGQLKEWRPQLFKAIVGTLVGLAAGESFGASVTSGFGVVGEDIARQEKVDAEIAKEDRKFQKDVALKGIEATGKLATAKKDMLKFTTKQINSASTKFQEEFFRSMDKKMKEKLNKKVPDIAGSYRASLSSFAQRAGISENELMVPSNTAAKSYKRIFDAGMRDWMKALRQQAQGDDDISLSSSPDGFIRARSYHSKLGANGKKNGNIAPMLLKNGALDAEGLLTLRASVDAVVSGSENYQNADEVFKALVKGFRKLSKDDRDDMTFLDYANSQVGQLK